MSESTDAMDEFERIAELEAENLELRKALGDLLEWVHSGMPENDSVIQRAQIVFSEGG